MQSSLTPEVAADIRTFVESQRELMFNELDFQIQLAVALRATGRYDDVDVEYSLPVAALDGYDGGRSLRVDIVVSRGGEFCAVELKYPTRMVKRDITRFGCVVPDAVVMKNQGAQDIVRYNFWKDVRRVELLVKRFKSVTGGVVVMMTNDTSYTRGVRAYSACAPFSTAEGSTVGGGTVDWQGRPMVRTNHPPFELDGIYTVSWHPATIDGIQFNYTIITI